MVSKGHKTRNIFSQKFYTKYKVDKNMVEKAPNEAHFHA